MAKGSVMVKLAVDVMPKVNRMIDWEGYIKRNTKGVMDCQLVTAINAYYRLTGKKIRQGSAKYNFSNDCHNERSQMIICFN